MKMRRIKLVHTMNTRDLGGYPLGSSGATRFGRILRSDAPCELVPEEVQYLKEFGVRTAIDLRSPAEAEYRPCSLQNTDGISYRHIPFAIGNRTPVSAEEVPLLYWKIVTDYSAMSRIMKSIAEEPETVLFFCSAGKDTTGVVAALLLLHTGVAREDILADYQISYTYIRPVIEAIRAKDQKLPSFYGRSDMEYMDALLDRFQEVYGSSEHYFEEIGLTEQERAILKQKLI